MKLQKQAQIPDQLAKSLPPSCPSRLLFFPYSVKCLLCFWVNVLAFAPQVASSPCFWTSTLEIIPVETTFLSSLCRSITFYVLLKIHLFQKERRWKGSWKLEGRLIKAMLIWKQHEDSAGGSAVISGLFSCSEGLFEAWKGEFLRAVQQDDPNFDYVALLTRLGRLGWA